MARRLDRLASYGANGIPRYVLTWSQRVCEQIEAEFGALETADEALAAAIAAQTTADSKAKVTRASSAPASPSVNDVWVDTSVSPRITKTWTGAVWSVAATEGADLAANVSNNTLANVTDTGTRKALATNAVQTSYIQNNAVTNPTSAYTAGSVVVPNTSTWTDIQTVTLTATGAPILVQACFYAGTFDAVTINSLSMQYQLVRGSTVIFGPVSFGFYQDGAANYRGIGANSPLILDQPSSGSQTYRLQAYSSNAGNTCLPNSRSLIVSEFKK